ncbi:hypothetical protein RHAL1_00009 [Beijerinckiaceae bacterium RH AL1]|nr:hypothetical protein [Beijerinckiaceae bacterium]VVB42083.1 hypothetical protein RHAL8_00009 [Beijerinckiaceae bacterium RH AL8]VVB42084.1 hypothetical protein RHCH11_RHCH11_00009 [Beijerinckiaceae bacterium RH CH11]VVC53129.1 hypothetical protein RHAL1_00009 [Beijerinckiaceae bacterium RH AL1]
MVSGRSTGRAIAGAAVLAFGLLAAGAAKAGDCNADIGNLSQKRQVFIDKLNVLAKSSKGKLDPVASCPVLRSLVTSEGALIKYLDANKNWCNVPDETVANLKAADAKSQTFAAQACKIAAMAAEQKKQATANPTLGADAQKLPQGPL